MWIDLLVYSLSRVSQATLSGLGVRMYASPILAQGCLECGTSGPETIQLSNRYNSGSRFSSTSWHLMALEIQRCASCSFKTTRTHEFKRICKSSPDAKVVIRSNKSVVKYFRRNGADWMASRNLFCACYTQIH